MELAWTWTPLRTAAAISRWRGLLLLVPLAGLRPWRLTRARGGDGRADGRHQRCAARADAGQSASLAGAQTHAACASRQDGGDALALARRRATIRRGWPSIGSCSRAWSGWCVGRRRRGTGRSSRWSTPDGEVQHRAPWVYEPLSRLWERGELVPTTVADAAARSTSPAGVYQLRLAFDRPEGIAPVPLATLQRPVAATDGSPAGCRRDAVTIGSDVQLWRATGPVRATLVEPIVAGRGIVARRSAALAPDRRDAERRARAARSWPC